MKQVRVQKYKIFEKFETHQHKLDFFNMINDFRKEHLRNSEYEKVTMDKIDELSKDVIFLPLIDDIGSSTNAIIKGASVWLKSLQTR